MDKMSEALAALGEIIQKIVAEVRKFLDAICRILVLHKRRMVVSYSNKDKISDLIRRYSWFGRRLRVRERILSGSTAEGRWVLQFLMTDAQYRDLMSKVNVTKFDWDLAKFNNNLVRNNVPVSKDFSKQVYKKNIRRIK